ncbi:4-hydroxythreonine-4-phosphate dehydrogenase PdxA [Aequorivita echinoideorum]|uniref:4-hydroxythreonine-4-phosphate dehydrogenase PdxA n=1 Tax=Aequorivita echinoideorum TaxID=1549647 RepID=A0ABS5S1P8_9FLAO|nr:4-hydroxythreonine-4-phosphate dehydrogenase PdxA [Aequorivita echinoideorum]MBT0607104.1 4-hydroxythreonine-4-phosphate dehydrogenase PdxA [Aequorivita echinoideorum]
MSKEDKIVVGISIGDINGIGSEIVLKTFEDARMLEFCTPVIFASVKLMSFFKKHFEIDINFHGIDKIEDLVPKKINVLNVWKEHVDVTFGEENKTGGEYAIKSLRSAVSELKNGKIDALVTAPINKSNIQSEDFNFPGHTDFLAKELQGESLMLMISEDLRVGLLTDHVAVKDVVKNITRERIDKKINTIYHTLVTDFGIERPKIAVLGINPHNGDNGVIGAEDDELLRPALDNIRKNGKMVFGPYAADSFFGSLNYKNFDAIIASYHDQGLVPFKTLSFGKGVNFTAGLNKVRTSPDHGTAFDLAGKNEANCESFREAVFSAISIFETRAQYAEISKNPLQPAKKKLYTKKKSK